MDRLTRTAPVTDAFPAALTDCSWTCASTLDATCSFDTTTGNIAHTITSFPALGTVMLMATCNVSSTATGTLSNTAIVIAPIAVTDPNLGNNSYTVVDNLSSW